MLIVSRFLENKTEQLILVFGLGLLGQAILQALSRDGITGISRIPFSWADADDQDRDAQLVLRRTQECAIGDVTRIDIVWSAGRAGFFASDVELENELRCFQKVVSLAVALETELRRADLVFHFVSSAGGIFEGQNVTVGTKPVALRPYASTKLREERDLVGSPLSGCKLIYRPSSVYGLGAPGTRKGLINTLIEKTVLYQPALLVGRPETLRDYVLATDVGGYISRMINQPVLEDKVVLLASGKPTMLFEIVARLAKIMRRKVFHRYLSDSMNIADTTFDPSVLPEDWHATDLETGMRQTARIVARSIYA